VAKNKNKVDNRNQYVPFTIAELPDDASLEQVIKAHNQVVRAVNILMQGIDFRIDKDSDTYIYLTQVKKWVV